MSKAAFGLRRERSSWLQTAHEREREDESDDAAGAEEAGVMDEFVHDRTPISFYHTRMV